MTIPSSEIKWRYFIIVLLTLAGVALSIIAFSVTWKADRQKVRLEFDLAAENRYAALKREIEADLETLVSIQAFFATDEKVERTEFRKLTGPLLARHGSIQSLEWVPRISDAERLRYERKASGEGFAGFRLSERKSQGKMVPATHRPEYFPVYYVEPYKGNEIALGFDLASNPVRRETLERSRDSGEMLATARITLVQEKAGQYGIIVFAPIYRNGRFPATLQERREELQGFALGVFRVGDILEKSLSFLNAEGIDIYLYDYSAPEKERFLYGHPGRKRRSENQPISVLGAKTEPLLEFTRVMNVAGRQWMVLCRAAPAFTTARRSHEPWGVLGSGLLITMLAASYMVSQIRRTAGIELLVEERTDDLRKTNDGLSHEIAKRIKAEGALNQQLQFLQKLIDAIATPIFYKDTAGKYLGCNEAFAACQGRSREEIIGRTVFDLAPEDLAKVYETADNALFITKGIQQYENCVQYADGVRHEISFTKTIFNDLEGRVAGLVGVMFDITERKRAEKDILRLNKELAIKIAKLTLTQQRLVRKEKLATIGLLAGSVGNELRNPLGVMSNAVFYLNTIMADADETVKEYLEIIRHEIDNSQSIITDFLDGVRPITPKITRVTVGEIVDKVLRTSAIPGNILVKVDIPVALPCISADPTQVGRVLQKLINNAIQAMPGGGSIKVAGRLVQFKELENEARKHDETVIGAEALDLDPETGFIEISVEDTGEGIPPEYIDKIYEPLFTTRARGIGLGLTVCKNLTEANGGRIEVRSEPGKGTRFGIIFPVGA